MGDIDTTSNHPFYVIGKGWVTAGELEAGDEVYRLDGSTAVVTGSELERLDEPVKVYNLEVEDYHTYFVGDVPVLVHNYKTENDLYAGGNANKKKTGSKPPSGKRSDFGLDSNADPSSTMVNSGMTLPKSKHPYAGASTNEDKDALMGLRNKEIYKLPAGTVLPEGLMLNRDVPGGHNTLYPTYEMSLESFFELVMSLPWEKTGIFT